VNSFEEGSTEYHTEKQTYDKCRWYIKQYECSELKEALSDWFDGQLDIANYLGIHWHDLYRTDIKLGKLFYDAHKRYLLKEKLRA
jgi:hypothetical protein